MWMAYLKFLVFFCYALLWTETLAFPVTVTFLSSSVGRNMLGRSKLVTAIEVAFGSNTARFINFSDGHF